jgi:hypothetical protein
MFRVPAFDGVVRRAGQGSLSRVIHYHTVGPRVTEIRVPWCLVPVLARACLDLHERHAPWQARALGDP